MELIEHRRPLSAVVLAAGEGTRMRSEIPKPLHKLCGRAMAAHVLHAAAALPLDRVVVVVGYGANEVTKAVQQECPANLVTEFVEQPTRRGTGDAVAVGLTGFPESYADLAGADLLVLPGDTPLVRPSTLASLVTHHREAKAAATVLTAELADPSGYSRVIRGADGLVGKIVQDHEATAEEHQVTEVATQIYCFSHEVIAPVLRRLEPDGKGEYSLTAAFAVLHDAGYAVTSVAAADPIEAAGVNDRAQLSAAAAEVKARLNERLMRGGVTMTDPEATYIDCTVTIGRDVTLLPGVVLEGSTVIGDGAVIGPFARLVDCEVGPQAVIEQSSCERAVIGEGVAVGAYSVLEPGSRLAAGERVGPFFGRS